MIHATPHWDLLIVLSWTVVTLLVLGAVGVSVLSLILRRPVLVWVSTGLLACAILIASLDTVPAPAVLSALLTVLVLALSITGGGQAAVLALDLATGDSAPRGLHGGILVRESSTGETATAGAEHEVLRGGLTIGVLERLAVTGSIIAGFPEALAIIVAVKGVGRFTELAASEARERFIIGTLASFIWACACGILVHLVAS